MNKEYFVKLIIDVCNKFRPQIMNAPAKTGWDPIFRKNIDSQYTVKARRNGAIQAIAEEAAMFGFDLSEIVGAIEDKDGD